MNQVSNSIFTSYGILAVLFLGTFIVIVISAASNVFRGSGKPELMANTINSMSKTLIQAFIAILIIGTLSVLMIEKIVESKEGLPIISAIAGYILGQSNKSSKKVTNQ